MVRRTASCCGAGALTARSCPGAMTGALAAAGITVRTTVPGARATGFVGARTRWCCWMADRCCVTGRRSAAAGCCAMRVVVLMLGVSGRTVTTGLGGAGVRGMAVRGVVVGVGVVRAAVRWMEEGARGLATVLGSFRVRWGAMAAGGSAG